MPRIREYASNAERQAAYRARHRQPTDADLAAGARSLHGELREALVDGRSPLPAELLGDNAQETLRRLVFWVRGEVLPNR